MKGHFSSIPIWSFLGLVAVGLVISLAFARFELTVPKESELSKYPDFEVFLAGRQDFQGIRHMLDTGLYSFSFHTSYPTPDEFFKAVESAALPAGWSAVSANDSTREFERQSGDYPSAQHADHVTLMYDSKTSKVVFVMQPRYK
jgi:hypothetical protein